MTRHLLIAGALALFGAATADAQGFGRTPGFAPNVFNRQSQPVSPYLQLFAPSSPAINYFTQVRPQLQLRGAQGPAPFRQVAPANGVRQTFFPVVDTLSELDTQDPQATGMRPTGHPIGFGNSLGYFPQSAGAGAQQQRSSPAASLGAPVSRFGGR